MFSKPKTYRSEKYLKFVRSLPCCVCGNPLEVEAHHTVCGGKGLKGPDTYAIPLCPLHHREHDSLGKKTFYERHDLDRWELVAKTIEKYLMGVL